MDYSKIIEQRIANMPRAGSLTAATDLRHFSIITYLVDVARLRAIIPPAFGIRTVYYNNAVYGLVSAVNFIDTHFRFLKCPYARFRFPQTNYRAYIIDPHGNDCAWFFATTLGSPLAYLPQKHWKMPWYYTAYESHFQFSDRYNQYHVTVNTEDYRMRVDIEEDVQYCFQQGLFRNIDEERLVLTHPVNGFFKRHDGHIGTYKIWHPAMDIKTGKCKDAWFQVFEDLGLLSREQMKQPYSVLLTREIDFIIDLPPKIF